MSYTDFLIIFGGFLGSLCSILVKYGVKNEEFKKYGSYVVALILGFAVYGVYYYLKVSGFIPEFNNFALFGFSVFIGFAIDELARGFVSLIKKTD